MLLSTFWSLNTEMNNYQQGQSQTEGVLWYMSEVRVKVLL